MVQEFLETSRADFSYKPERDNHKRDHSQQKRTPFSCGALLGGGSKRACKFLGPRHQLAITAAGNPARLGACSALPASPSRGQRTASVAEHCLSHLLQHATAACSQAAMHAGLALLLRRWRRQRRQRRAAAAAEQRRQQQGWRQQRWLQRQRREAGRAHHQQLSSVHGVVGGLDCEQGGQALQVPQRSHPQCIPRHEV